MTATTYLEVLSAHGVTIPDHLEAQAAIPVLAGLQVQGDVAVIPIRPGIKQGTAVPAAGIAVVRGESGGNTHLLVAEGAVSWAPVVGTPNLLDLGVVTVDEEAIAYLLHPEHGANAMGPGAYTLRRQREQADELRAVAD
jgi:hypothetical protein